MNVNGIGANSLVKLAEANGQSNGGSSFKDLMTSQLDKLNESQINADKMTEAFIRGEVDDLHAVMIATEEARLSLDLALQIRNKAVEAYKEINNMQL
jgi:flagellar hook-basal body complex protein FliE